MARKIIRTVFVAIVGVLVTASSQAGAPQTEDAASTTADVASVLNWHEVAGGAWAVPDHVLAEMSGTIQAEASRHQRLEIVRPLSAYFIQYQGETREGRRSVRLAGACSKLPGVTDDALRARFLVVYDGGNCYFDATYDPSEHRFTAFWYHGHA